jgi:hypothetical protein
VERKDPAREVHPTRGCYGYEHRWSLGAHRLRRGVLRGVRQRGRQEQQAHQDLGWKGPSGRPRDRSDLQSSSGLGREIHELGKPRGARPPAKREVRCLLGLVHPSRVHGDISKRAASVPLPRLGLRSFQRGSGSLGSRSVPLATDTDKGARRGDLSYLTNIFRPEEGELKIVHCHADPLTTAQLAESVIQE